MKCVVCPGHVETDCKLCFRCQHDHQVVISYHEIKAKYKLTDHDIQILDIEPVDPGLDSKIYMISDLHDSLDKCIKKLPDSNKKKHIYMKHQENRQKMQSCKQAIKSDVIDLLDKYSITIDTHIDAKIDEYIDIYCTASPIANINNLEVTMQVINDIDDYNTDLINESNRKKELDDLIALNIDQKYVNMISQMPIYDEYVKLNKHTLNIAFGLISRFVSVHQNNEIKTDRVTELINVISNGFNVDCLIKLTDDEIGEIMRDLSRVDDDHNFFDVINQSPICKEILKKLSDDNNEHLKETKGAFQELNEYFLNSMGAGSNIYAPDHPDVEVCKRNRRVQKMSDYINKTIDPKYHMDIINHSKYISHIETGVPNYPDLKKILDNYLNRIKD